MYKKIFRTIYYVLLGGLTIIALLLVFSAFPIAGNYKTLMVLSGSMEPKIKTGSIVMVKGASTYKAGDVITFKGEGKTPTTHRIVEETKDGYVTRGDANNANDLKKLEPQNILGKVLFSIPYLGYLLAWVKTTPGLIIMIVIPAVIIIYSEALAIQKEIKKIIKQRREKKILEPVKVSAAAMPMPKIHPHTKGAHPKLFGVGVKKESVSPLPVKSSRAKTIKETAKKTLKASVIIFGFLSLLNLREIQGTRAFFIDEEKSSAEITAWVEEPVEEGDVLINEFLPNPGGTEYGFNFGEDTDAKPQGEWVELYNATSQTIDLAGYYLTDNDASHRINVEACRTNTGNTTITPNGFLVIYARGSGVCNNSHNFSLNNDAGGDTVKFYNPANQLFDSHSYLGNDSCDLQPTPGAQNANNPSGTCSGVPPNKSYARIPDGSSNWVDPIPTPGKPNILGNDNIQTASQNEVKKDVVSSPPPDTLGSNDSTPAVLQTITGGDNDSTPATENNIITDPGDSAPATDTLEEKEQRDNDSTEDPSETEDISPASSSDDPQADLAQEDPATDGTPSTANEEEDNNNTDSSLSPPENPEPEISSPETSIEETPSPPADSSPLENLNNS